MTLATNLEDHQPSTFQLFDDDLKKLKTYLLVQTAATKQVVSLQKTEAGPKVVTETFSSFISGETGCQQPPAESVSKLSKTHGSLFLDVNMDCKPDLLLETINGEDRILDIYLFTDKGKFCLTEQITLTGAGNNQLYSSVSSLDVASKGSNDLVFMREAIIEGKITLEAHVLLNKFSLPDGQTVLCAETSLKSPFDDIKTTMGKNFTQVRYQY